MANCQELVASGLASEWDDKHRVWIGRQYFRLRHNATTPPNQPTKPVASLPAPVVIMTPVSTSPSWDGGVRQVSTIDTMLVTVQEAGIMLKPAYPNPFDMSSLIGYQIPESSFVSVRIFDLQGRLIQNLVQQKQTPGVYEVWLDVSEFPADGVYVCQLQAGRELRTQRIQILH